MIDATPPQVSADLQLGRGLAGITVTLPTAASVTRLILLITTGLCAHKLKIFTVHTQTTLIQPILMVLTVLRLTEEEG